MKAKLKPLLVASVGLTICSSAAFAGSTNAAVSPIFGHASIQKLSIKEDRAIVGKGYLSDYYGYYGLYYSSLASEYGSMGFYYKNYSDYYYAYQYASYASTDFYDAYYWQYYGY